MTTGNKEESSWLSQSGPDIEPDNLIKLYEVYGKQASDALDLHYKNRSYYLIIISALLTIFIGGILEFHQTEVALILLAVPISTILLSHLAKDSMDRYYQRFLESVIVLAKIEHILGLDGPIKDRNSRLSKSLWKDDTQFVPKRWVRDRAVYDSSKEFKEAKMKEGDNSPSKKVFTSLQIVAAILFCISLWIFLPFRLDWMLICSIAPIPFLVGGLGWLVLVVLFYLVLYVVPTKL